MKRTASIEYDTRKWSRDVDIGAILDEAPINQRLPTVMTHAKAECVLRRELALVTMARRKRRCYALQLRHAIEQMAQIPRLYGADAGIDMPKPTVIRSAHA